MLGVGFPRKSLDVDQCSVDVVSADASRYVESEYNVVSVTLTPNARSRDGKDEQSEYRRA